MKHFLIVVDMQKDFVDGALGSAEAVAIVPTVVEKIEGFDGEIFATFDTHGADYLETAEGRHLPVPHCIKGTDGWKLDAAVAAALEKRGYTAVEKNRGGLRPGAHRPVHRHLRRQQRAAAQGELSRSTYRGGRGLLRGRHAGEARSRAGDHAKLSDRAPLMSLTQFALPD